MLRSHLRLFAAFAFVTIALAVAGVWLASQQWTVVAIHYSYSPQDASGWEKHSQVAIGTTTRALLISTATNDVYYPSGRRDRWNMAVSKSPEVTPKNTFWQRLGFFWRHTKAPADRGIRSAYISPGTAICVPWWLIELFLLAVSVYLFTQWRKHRRHPKGHCQRCGYNLRETPRRCPECGTPVGASSQLAHL